MPEICEVPSAIAENSTARCEMLLSPGTRVEPVIGADNGRMTVLPASVDMGMLLWTQRAERYRKTCLYEMRGQLPDIAFVSQNEA